MFDPPMVLRAWSFAPDYLLGPLARAAARRAWVEMLTPPRRYWVRVMPESSEDVAILPVELTTRLNVARYAVTSVRDDSRNRIHDYCPH